jgi:hypothetical protein
VGPLLKELVDRIPEADARSLREQLGFSDLSQAVDLVVVGGIVDFTKSGTPGYQAPNVIIVRTANQFDVARVWKALEPSSERLESDGKVIYRDRKDGTLVHAPSNQYVVVAWNLPQSAQSEFLSLLKAADAKAPSSTNPRFGPFRSGDLWLAVEGRSFEQQIRQAGAMPGLAPIAKEVLDQLLAVKQAYVRINLVDDRVALTVGAWSVNEANARSLAEVLQRSSKTQIGSTSVTSMLVERSKQEHSPHQHEIVKDAIENLRIYSRTTLTVATSQFRIDPAIALLRKDLPRSKP